MTTIKKIEVMQAYEDGKAIECKPQRSNEWKDMSAYTPTTPVWNWEICNYRIKPEVQETLKDKIKAKWSQYEVVMCKEREESLDWVLNMAGLPLHISAQSMKGFQGFVYEREDGLKENVLSIICDGRKYIQPVAVLFEKGE